MLFVSYPLEKDHTDNFYPINIMSEAHQEITDADIAYILENPWEKSKGEWRLANVSERQETLQFIKERLRSTQTGGVFQNMENAGQ